MSKPTLPEVIMSKLALKPTLKTTAEQRDHWRRDVPIHVMLKNDFIDNLVADVESLLADNERLRNYISGVRQDSPDPEA